MIKFVHIGKQIDNTNDLFAFFTTYGDCFIPIGNTYVFNSLEELKACLAAEGDYTADQKSRILAALPSHMTLPHESDKRRKKGK